MKCNRIGCERTEVLHAQVPILGGLAFADAYFCQEHYEYGIRSLMGETRLRTSEWHGHGLSVAKDGFYECDCGMVFSDIEEYQQHLRDLRNPP